ncbi:MAG: 50S ribosomal protein L4 [Candidatus Parcubacteria bacterium]|nr:MAG: 50S ribosomal protein L4 [Candidatus Parcubacteria bacterium]
MEATLYNWTAEPKGTITLPPEVFGDKWRPTLVHQVIVGMLANARAPVAHAKDRSEIRGGGRKPWRQKGTGRARHGSTRSPIWRGGGKAHGPRNTRDFSVVLPRKMRTRALTSALSRKLIDGEVVFLTAPESFSAKTKEAKALLAALASLEAFAPLAEKPRNAAVIVTPHDDAAVRRGFANIPSVKVVTARELSARDVLTKRFVVFVDAPRAVEALAQRVAVALAPRTGSPSAVVAPASAS